MPRPMKTTLERRSPSGQSSRWTGRMDDVLDAVQDDRPRAADVQEALHPQDVLAAGLEQHRQPDAERGPVERLRRTTSVKACRIVVRRRPPPERATRGSRAGLRPSSRSGSASPKDDSRISAAGFRARSRCSSASISRSLDQVGLRHDEAVGGGACRSDSGSRSSWLHAVDASTVVTTDSSSVVMLNDGLRDERREDRRRIGEPGRLDDDPAEAAGSPSRWRRPRRSRSSSARSPRIEQQTQPLAEQRRSARRPGAAGGGRSRPRRAR